MAIARRKAFFQDAEDAHFPLEQDRDQGIQKF